MGQFFLADLGRASELGRVGELGRISKLGVSAGGADPQHPRATTARSLQRSQRHFQQLAKSSTALKFSFVISTVCNALCPDSGSTGHISQIFDLGKREPIHIRISDIELFVTAASAFVGLYDLR